MSNKQHPYALPCSRHLIYSPYTPETRSMKPARSPNSQDPHRTRPEPRQYVKYWLFFVYFEGLGYNSTHIWSSGRPFFEEPKLMTELRTTNPNPRTRNPEATLKPKTPIGSLALSNKRGGRGAVLGEMPMRRWRRPVC